MNSVAISGFIGSFYLMEQSCKLYNNTYILCFFDEFAKNLRHPFYRTPSGNYFCSIKKYFTIKLEIAFWKKGKKNETAGKKKPEKQ